MFPFVTSSVCAGGSRWMSRKAVDSTSWGKSKRMKSGAFEYITEHQGSADARVEKGFDAELVACTKKSPGRTMPYREDKIAEYVVDARNSPDVIRVKNQLSVGRFARNHAPGGAQFLNQLPARVHPCVGCYPGISVKVCRLLFTFCLECGREQSMAEPP